MPTQQQEQEQQQQQQHIYTVHIHQPSERFTAAVTEELSLYCDKTLLQYFSDTLPVYILRENVALDHSASISSGDP